MVNRSTRRRHAPPVSRVGHDDRAIAESQLRPMVTHPHPLGEPEDADEPVDSNGNVVVGQDRHNGVRRQSTSSRTRR